MGFLGTLCGVLAVTLTGLQLAESGAPAPSCATPEKIAEINLMVDDFQVVVDGIMASDGSQTEKFDRVFGLTCRNATYKAMVDKLSLDISQCLELVSVTKIPLLSFGPMTFIQLISSFPTGGFVEFCECSPYLPAALALDQMKGSYSLVVSNGEYDTVGNLPFYCEENMVMGAETVNVRALLTNSLMGLDGECRTIYTIAGMTSRDMAADIRSFLTSCPTFDAARFQCALDKSTTTEFKTCLNNAAGGEAACTKYGCLRDHMMQDSQCGESGTKSYMESVNIQKGMDELVVKTDNECNGTGTVYLSLAVLFGSMIIGILF